MTAVWEGRGPRDGSESPMKTRPRTVLAVGACAFLAAASVQDPEQDPTQLLKDAERWRREFTELAAAMTEFTDILKADLGRGKLGAGDVLRAARRMSVWSRPLTIELAQLCKELKAGKVDGTDHPWVIHPQVMPTLRAGEMTVLQDIQGVWWALARRPVAGAELGCWELRSKAEADAFAAGPNGKPQVQDGGWRGALTYVSAKDLARRTRLHGR